MPNLRLRKTVGLVGGLNIQFAEGRWPGEQLGEGVAMSLEAFELVEPLLRAAAPGWTPMHFTGVFELPSAARALLARSLRTEASRLRTIPRFPPSRSRMLDKLAEWLEARCDERPITILGV